MCGALLIKNSVSSRSQFKRFESEWQKFLWAPKCPVPNSEDFSHVSRGHPPPLHAPSTFLLLCPYAPKLAPIARYCRRSFWRALDEVVATRFHTRMMKRLIRTVIQLISFLQFFWKGESLMGLQVKYSNLRVLLVLASILHIPGNNPGYSMKEMTLAGRPESYG